MLNISIQILALGKIVVGISSAPANIKVSKNILEHTLKILDHHWTNFADGLNG